MATFKVGQRVKINGDSVVSGCEATFHKYLDDPSAMEVVMGIDCAVLVDGDPAPWFGPSSLLVPLTDPGIELFMQRIVQPLILEAPPRVRTLVPA